MSQYFDRDFFKFLLGFIAIISLSLVLIFAARMYSSQTDVPREVMAETTNY